MFESFVRGTSQFWIMFDAQHPAVSPGPKGRRALSTRGHAGAGTHRRGSDRGSDRGGGDWPMAELVG